MISLSQRPITDNTQHTDIQALGGIRTHDRSRRAAVDLGLRPRGHWDRPSVLLVTRYFYKLLLCFTFHTNLFVASIKNIPILKIVESIIYLILSVFKESKAVFANECTYIYCNFNIYWYEKISLYFYSGIKICL